MVSFRQAQTGNRVYGGVSQSPNRGQVSARGAQGYIQRELRNKAAAGPVRRVGNDGKSDNRSAVAARALGRKQQFNNSGRPNVQGKQQFNNQGRPQQAGGKQSFQNEGRPVGNQPSQGVTVNEDGVLVLPYNQEFSADQYAAVAEANEQLLALNAERGQRGLEYQQNRRDSELAYGQQQLGTLNQNAAEGTAFSSRYGTAVANNATAHANRMADIESDYGAFQQNYALQIAAIQNALNQQLGLGAQAYANELGDQAGSLGYGTTGSGPSGSNSRGSKGNKGSKNGPRGNEGRPGRTGSKTPKSTFSNRAIQKALKKRGK